MNKIKLTNILLDFELDKPTSSGRIYPKEVWIKALKEYKKRLKNESK